MGQEYDVHPAPDQGVQRCEKFGEFLCQDNVAFPITKILDGIFVRFPADMLGQTFFRPIAGIQNQRFELVRSSGEVSDRPGDVLPSGDIRESGDVEMRSAALGIEEDRIGELACEGRLADAFRAVDDCFLGPTNPACL